MRSLVSVALAASVACSPSMKHAAAPNEVTGVITSIRRSDEGAIESFTVEQGGHSYDIRLQAGHDYGFDLEHLAEHRAGRLPVRVILKERDGALYAVEILDA